MKDEYILIKTKQFIERLPADEVLSVQRDGRKVLVVAEDREYEYYDSMENVLNHLDDRFYKAHGGLVVNLDKIRLMKDQEIQFYNGYSMFLGRSNFIKAKQKYYSYLKTH
ncbi:MAG: LytTR family transcriptional regulator DNA-binding domain-containing protein [Clostridia bacterium]|nr:LytTR family transcriptional regulator DNA-binding domain-containing protein [Clostridia bacterium]